MKAYITIILPFIWLLSVDAIAQIGIGVTNPTESLSVSDGLNIDHNNLSPGGSLTNGLKFGNTATTSQMVGISSNRSGGANSYGLEFYTGNTRRMFIANNGLVGINIVPTSYFLEVGGTIRAVNGLRTDGSVVSDNDVSAGNSITAGNNITAAEDLKATNGDIIATNGNISATNGVLLAGNRGVVMSSNSSRQKVVAYTAALTVTNLASESSVVGAISIPAGTFTSAPTAYVGNVVSENGEYYKALLVLENVTTSNISIRVVNPTPNPISFSNAQWKILALGPY